MKDFNKSRIRYDIIILMNLINNWGWKSLKRDSIHRILYLSGVLYHFVYDEMKDNPFKIYHFSRKGAGPFDVEIHKAIDFLLKDDFLIVDEKKSEVFSNKIIEQNVNIEDYRKTLENWLNLIIQILAIYGEDKIYEFIFRDKEFKDLVASNAEKNLNLGPQNATIQYLEKFRKAFEKQLNFNPNELDRKTYLELYFEYIFKQILERQQTV